MKRFIFALLLLTATVPAPGRTIRILAIGNSFSVNAVEQNLYELALEGGDTLIIGNCYRPGQSLAAHWREVENDDHKIEYRKIVAGVRTVRPGCSLHDCLLDEAWDCITFQQASHDSGLPESYEPALTHLIEYVSSVATNPNVKFGFHQTWAYARNSTHKGFARYAYDQQIMYQAIRWTSVDAVRWHDTLRFIIPCGEAIQRLRATRMGDNFCSDGYHLNAAGCYAAACTWLAVLTGQNPTKRTYRPQDIAEQDACLIRQEVARVVRRKSKK